MEENIDENLKKKNEDRNIKILLYVVIFFIIMTGAVFFLFGENSIFGDKYTYENKNTGDKFSFRKEKIDEGLILHTLTAYSIYQRTGHKYDISFRNNPKEIETIFIDDVRKNILGKERLYITLDPNYKGKAVVASVELGRVLGEAEWGVFKIPTSAATIEKTNTTYPVVTCKDVNSRTGVIWLRLGNTTSVTSYKGCVIVEGTDYDNLIKAADKLAYYLLGVMPR